MLLHLSLQLAHSQMCTEMCDIIISYHQGAQSLFPEHFFTCPVNHPRPSKFKCGTGWYKLFLLFCCITCLRYTLPLLNFKNTHQLPEICHNKKCAPEGLCLCTKAGSELVFAFPACHWKTLEVYHLFFCCEASRQNLVLGVSPVAAAGGRITGCSVQPSKLEDTGVTNPGGWGCCFAERKECMCCV